MSWFIVTDTVFSATGNIRFKIPLLITIKMDLGGIGFAELFAIASSLT